MLRFLLRRAVLAVLVCLTVLVISFALTRLSGDLAISIAGPNATAQDIETIRKNYGLDRPLPVQFVDWAVHAAEGDLGRSYLYHAPVAGLIKERLPITLTLGLTGLVIALSLAIPARHHRCHARGFRDRQGDRPARTDRPGDAELLAVAGADHLARSAASTFADLRRRYLGRLRHARRRAGVLRHPRADAPDACGDDRRAVIRLHPHRARQGTVHREDRAEARAAQRGDAGGVGGRGAAWLHARRLDRHRGDLRAARRRLSGVGIDQQERLPGGAGGRADSGHHLYRPYARRRHDERGARSAAARPHERDRTAAAAPDAARAPSGDRTRRADRRRRAAGGDRRALRRHRTIRSRRT